jgi:hypothetical protein
MTASLIEDPATTGAEQSRLACSAKLEGRWGLPEGDKGAVEKCERRKMPLKLSFANSVNASYMPL